MKKGKRIDLVLVLLFPILASILSLLLNVNALGSVILFLVIPSIYLSFRAKNCIKKSIIFSAIISIPGIIVIDYIGHLTHTWIVPNSIFPFRVFGLVPIEDISWAFFISYYTIMFYEYFLDKHTTKKLWDPRLKYLAIMVLIFSSIFVIILFGFSSLLNIPYFYMWWGAILLLIPLLIVLFIYPKLSSKFLKTGVYFFLMTMIYELTALKLGWWYFPSETKFIGWVSILGLQFPFEEFFFWLMLFAMSFLSYYEFFADDRK